MSTPALTPTNKVTSEQIAALTKATTLEEMLERLCALGNPRIHHMGNGWLCVIEMHVSAAGADFKVRSDMNHKRPSEAARECIDRALTVLSQYTK